MYRYHFSIITVCYNSSETISRTIQSVIEQTKTFSGSIQYLIIDGKSTDDTLRVIDDACVNLPNNITLNVISESDSGIYDAMNKGIMLAEGNVIGIINSDDEYVSGVFNECWQHFYNDSDLSIIHANVNWKYSLTGYPSLFMERKGSPEIEDLFKGMTINHPTVFCRKEIYQRFGLFNLKYRYSADWSWFLMIANVNVKIKYIDKIYAIFDMSGVSNRFISNRYKENLSIYNELYNKKKIHLGTYLLRVKGIVFEYIFFYWYFLFTSENFRNTLRYKKISKRLKNSDKS
jgi:glycosyltransferase involved in cell wall biosynthesis